MYNLNDVKLDTAWYAYQWYLSWATLSIQIHVHVHTWFTTTAGESRVVTVASLFNVVHTGTSCWHSPSTYQTKWITSSSNHKGTGKQHHISCRWNDANLSEKPFEWPFYCCNVPLATVESKMQLICTNFFLSISLRSQSLHLWNIREDKWNLDQYTLHTKWWASSNNISLTGNHPSGVIHTALGVETVRVSFARSLHQSIEQTLSSQL